MDLTNEKDMVKENLTRIEINNKHVVEEVANLKRDYDIWGGGGYDNTEKGLDSLKWKLEMAPTRESILEEFQKLLRDVEDVVVHEYLTGPDHKMKLDAIVEQFMRGPEFQRAVGEKTKLMVPYFVECFLVYFQYDIQRSRGEC